MLQVYVVYTVYHNTLHYITIHFHCTYILVFTLK